MTIFLDESTEQFKLSWLGLWSIAWKMPAFFNLESLLVLPS